VKLRVCTECGEELDSRQYNNHMKKRHRPKKAPESANCEHCGQFFKSKVNLKRHLARFHGVGELKLRSNNILKECGQCGKRLKTDERFRAHMFLEHGVELPGLRRRDCVVCKEVFYVKVQYDAHMMLHSGVKKYACDRCDYSTRFSANLVSHKRRSHSDKNSKNSAPLVKQEPADQEEPPLPTATKSEPVPVDLSTEPLALSDAPPNTIILVQGSNFLVPLSVGGLSLNQQLLVAPCVGAGQTGGIPVTLDEVHSGKLVAKVEDVRSSKL
jgi:transcription elongation factor Elf1